MRLLPILFSVSLLAACEGAQLQDGRYTVVKGSAASGEVKAETVDAGSTPSPDATLTKTDTASSPGEPMIDMPSPEAAHMPVAIGGASLFCSVPNIEVALATCFAKQKSGALADFAAQKAYFIDSQDLNWAETSFIRKALGTFEVSLPYKVKDKSFAIGFVNNDNKTIVDWVIDANDPIPKAVVDGGFEDIRYDGSFATQFLDPAHQKAWKAKSKTANCADVIEMANVNTAMGILPVEGDQWVELDSVCKTESFLSGGNNIVLYQDLKLEPDHIYQITFQFSGRPGATQKQEFQVRFGDEEILKMVVTDDKWQSYTFTRRVIKERMRIEFEESGIVDGRGTLLDNVVVSSVGTGPK
ncbi:MAG: hypothetical protein EOP07_09050 [Proteobacteria bacterium]|nr:MAG: hypothetical protein EOP07_09050 [Pseudomonadota bacterium]